MKTRWGWSRAGVAAVLLPVMLTVQAMAWGGDGHRMINRIAAENLPQEVPEFLRSGQALDTMEYLGPEPDRWKSKAEPELGAAQELDHFIDIEYADRLGTLPRRRYDYVRALAVLQQAHPELPLTVESVGTQPYAAEEVWERLKAGFRAYRALVAAKGETKPAELAITFYAGWLGHYVADGSQPLHTTVQYNGWTGPNPKGYATDHTIHARFESTFVTAAVKASDVEALVAAAKPKVIDDEWTQYLEYLHHSNTLVEQTYVLDKAGAFTDAGTPEGKAFAEERLAAGAIELRDLIETAWVKSADPVPGAKN